MGALAYTERVHAALYVGAHGSTFGGNPLACAAGLAAITAYPDERIVERAAQMGDLLLAKLRAALAETPVVREVRGLGMMVGIDLRQKPGPYLKRLMDEHGVLALPAGASVLRLLPPLIASEQEIDLAVAAIAQVLADHA
jgi:acetylornithine/LysW-gamma-L-lysine aminotransferase